VRAAITASLTPRHIARLAASMPHDGGPVPVPGADARFGLEEYVSSAIGFSLAVVSMFEIKAADF
jgi:hypothetical protein